MLVVSDVASDAFAASDGGLIALRSIPLSIERPLKPGIKRACERLVDCRLAVQSHSDVLPMAVWRCSFASCASLRG